MDNCRDFVYFINSQGKRAVLSSPDNRNYWELRGRSGFTAPEVDLFSEKYASGSTKYYGKALKPRNMTMQMVCVGESTAERDRIFFEMVDTLVDAVGAGEGQLWVKRSDGSMVYISCVYSGGMNIVEQYHKFHKFSLSFYAADPWFYGAEKDFDLHDILGSSPGSETLQITVTNGFHADMVCRFTWEAMVSTRYIYDGYIENLATGKKIAFPIVDDAPPLYIDEKLTVDFDPEHLEAYIETTTGTYRNGTFAIDWLNTDRDFLLVPGDNIMDFNNCGSSVYSLFTQGHMFVKPRFMSA